MAIRYDANYNSEIRRVVKNFNQKRNRAIKRGFKNVPEQIKVSDLKARYTSRKDLNKQLRLISRFATSRDVLSKVENQGGATAIEWELEYLKANEKLAREFFVREYARLAPKTVDFPGERMQLDNIAAKIKLLDLDTAYMNQKQFNSYRATINEFLNKPKNYAASYRGFLSEIEAVMRYIGYDDQTINKFFNKFKGLTPEQFHNLYENSDLVSRIYELADSPSYGELKINTSLIDAKGLVDTLLNVTDDLVARAKEDRFEREPLSEWEVEAKLFEDTVKQVKRQKPTDKTPLSQLSKKQIHDLKELDKIDPGWWKAVVDENK